MRLPDWTPERKPQPQELVDAILAKNQTGGDIEQVAHSIAERDHIDSTRADSPLRPHEESILVDSSGKSIDDVVSEIVTIFNEREG